VYTRALPFGSFNVERVKHEIVRSEGWNFTTLDPQLSLEDRDAGDTSA